MLEKLERAPGTPVTIDLETETVEFEGATFPFSIDPFRRSMLLKGLDAIDLTLEASDAIDDYETRAPAWVRLDGAKR